MKKKMLGMAALGFIALNSLIACGVSPQATPSPAVTVAPEEDEPGWDCRIHGNLACTADELEARR